MAMQKVKKLKSLTLPLIGVGSIFLQKPLFFVIDYLFKLSGNFGIAIVLITLAIRVIFSRYQITHLDQWLK